MNKILIIITVLFSLSGCHTEILPENDMCSNSLSDGVWQSSYLKVEGTCRDSFKNIATIIDGKINLPAHASNCYTNTYNNLECGFTLETSCENNEYTESNIEIEFLTLVSNNTAIGTARFQFGEDCEGTYRAYWEKLQ
jgi:hypothetical protein